MNKKRAQFQFKSASQKQRKLVRHKLPRQVRFECLCSCIAIETWTWNNFCCK